jgi:hypothetical protein
VYVPRRADRPEGDNSKMKMRLLLLLLLSVLPANAIDKQLLGTAKSTTVLYDVVWNKNRPFNSKLQLSRMYTAVTSTNLGKYFSVVSRDSDIIMKLHEDVMLIGSETISLTVFDPDDNGVIYSEERPLIDQSNDIKRLVSHFLDKVREARLAVMKLKELKSTTVTVRPGGMKVLFNDGIEPIVRKALIGVLDGTVEEKSIEDPEFTVEFWPKDGNLVSYEVRYKGVVTISSKYAKLSPEQFKDEIRNRW